MRHEDLNGLRILIVEDEPMLAFVFRAMLEEAGGQVVCMASSTRPALDFIESNEFDCAIMDVRLKDETVFPVADAMSLRHIPFAFITGNSPGTMPPEHQDRPMLLKPVNSRELIGAVAGMAGGLRANCTKNAAWGGLPVH